MANQWNELKAVASSNIEKFSLNINNYKRVYENPITKEGFHENHIYVKDAFDFTKLNISFKPNVTGCKIFLGRNFSGQHNIVTFEQDNGVFYVGDNCDLVNTRAYIQTGGGAILVGNNVVTTGTNIWWSGAYPGSGFAAIVIGDSCLLSWGITLRGSDSHPIFNITSWEQVNTPNNFLAIEPYVWVGQDVSILKGVTIGACSIVGLGSVVTKSVPRFSVASGNPASVSKRPDNIWVRNRSKASLDMAQKYLDLYSLT